METSENWGVTQVSGLVVFKNWVRQVAWGHKYLIPSQLKSCGGWFTAFFQAVSPICSFIDSKRNDPNFG